MTDTFDAPLAEPIVEMSDKIDAIAKVLPKAQAAMGEVFKTANNPAFRSKYANLSAVVEAVVPALNAHGIMLLQPERFDGQMVHVGTMLLHESGQWIRSTLAVPVSKRDAHGIGSASTYGRRYGLQAMSGVAPEDDDGNGAVGNGQGQKEPPPPSKRAPPQQGPTLEQRTTAAIERLNKAATPNALDAAWSLTERLRDDLGAADDEHAQALLGRLDKTHRDRRAALTPKTEAA